MSDTMTKPTNKQIASREHHIIRLARIVGTEQGIPTTDAPVAMVRGNSVKVSHWVSCDVCGLSYDWGEAQWHAVRHVSGAEEVLCPGCLPGKIERGEVILDRRSAHRTLAFMLGGQPGKDA